MQQDGKAAADHAYIDADDGGHIHTYIQVNFLCARVACGSNLAYVRAYTKHINGAGQPHCAHILLLLRIVLAQPCMHGCVRASADMTRMHVHAKKCLEHGRASSVRLRTGAAPNWEIVGLVNESKDI